MHVMMMCIQAILHIREIIDSEASLQYSRGNKEKRGASVLNYASDSIPRDATVKYVFLIETYEFIEHAPY